MLRNLLRLTLLLAFYIVLNPVSAQHRTQQNWWMGSGPRGIQFTQPNDSALLVTRSLTSIGASGYGNAGGFVASDVTSGALLFYTDGSVMYDANHELMQNGTGLGGNPAGNQPAVGVRVPGSITQYWVFTNDATPATAGQVRVTEVDMTLLGNNFDNPALPAPPLGDVVVGTKATPVADLNNVAEGMIIIPHDNNTDYWLITQVRNTTTFNVSLITSAGIQPATPVPVTNVPFTFTAAHLAFHEEVLNPDLTQKFPNRLAVAPSDGNQNILLFEYDATAGTIDFETVIVNSGVTGAFTPPAIYDVEFSPLAEYLYASHQDLLLQYDLENFAVAPDTIFVTGMTQSYGLQVGSDSSVYHLYDNGAGNLIVGRLTVPDIVADSVNYERTPFGNIDFAATQFPQFLPSTPVTVTLDFTAVGSCQNSPVAFFPTVTPAADSLNWNFGDGVPPTPPGGSNDWAPTYTFPEDGTFSVTVTAFLNGVATSYTEPVTITPFDVQLSLTQDTTACSCELTSPKIPPPPSTYPNGQPCNPFTLTAQVTGSASSFQWYGPSGLLAGQTSATLSAVAEAGFYYLIAEANGCSAYAGVNIKEYGVEDPRANIWHFGNNGGIDFNPDFNPATGADPISGPVVSAEGVATISDQNGQVILSTNGEQVFDRLGTPAPFVAGGLGGSQFSTQSSLIIPFPNDPTLYYIFLTQDIYPQTAVPGYELRYAIFDLKRGTHGELVPMDPPANTQYSAVLFTKTTERLTGNEGWLIAHEYGNNNFRAYPLTGTGLGSPIISSVGSVHSQAIQENGQGYMKLSGQNILAVALSTPGVSNVVEYFDFIDSTGVVTNFRTADLAQAGGQVYGIAFSPGGRKMYASTTNPGSIHEFAYDSVTSTYIKRSELPVIPTPSNVGAIEMGPDGTIYVATDGAGSLGVITPNEDKKIPSTYDPTQFALAGGTSSTLGLPNFIQNINQALSTPTIAVVGNCFGLPTTFTGSGTDVIDTLTWQFGDGSSQSGVNLTQVEHTYAAPGTYTVTLEVANRCKGVVGLLNTTVEIFGTPTIQESNLTLCNGGTDEQFTAVDPADPHLATYTFLWNTGETTNTISPQMEGNYSVSVTTAELCVVTGQFVANDARPQVDLGPDRIVCENTSVGTFDAGNVGSTYVWTLTSGSGSTVVTDPLDPQRYSLSTTTPGNYRLVVEVTNPFNACESSDTTLVSVNPQALLLVGTINHPTACLNSDGSFDFSISTSGTYFYTVTNVADASLITGGNQNGPSGAILVPNLSAGGYNVAITHQVTGCLDSETVGLSDQGAGFTVTIQRAQACNNPGTSQIPIELTTNAGTPYDYQILGEISTNVFAQGTNIMTSPIITTPVPNAFFVAEVTAANGCIVVSDPPTLIRQDPPVIIQAMDANECATPVTITPIIDPAGEPAVTYAWTGTAIVAGTEDDATVQVNPASGVPTTYDVVVSGGAATCPAYASFTVTANGDPAPSFTQNDACQDNVTLSATPVGPYAYAWTRAGVPVTGAQQIFITAADNGLTYGVSVQNTNTGCTSTEFLDDVSVLGLLTVDLSNPQPCEGTDFTLETTVNQTGTLTYSWFLDDEVITNQTNPTLTVTDDADGEYKVVVSRTGCPPVEDFVEINVSPTTPGNLMDVGIICPSPENTDPATRTRLLDAGPGFRSYQWLQDGSPLAGETNQTYLASEVAVYTVELVNAYGCASTDEITLRDECDPRVTGPNAFRPGGLNKEFSLFTFFITDEDFEIYIFNRWGEMVFYSNDRQFAWNGGYKNNAGQPVPPGTYTYLLKFKSSYRPEQGIEELRGGVVLLR